MNSFEENELIELVENIQLNTKRLNCLLEFVLYKDINLINKIIIKDFAKKIAYNIKLEIENISCLLS